MPALGVPVPGEYCDALAFDPALPIQIDYATADMSSASRGRGTVTATLTHSSLRFTEVHAAWFKATPQVAWVDRFQQALSRFGRASGLPMSAGAARSSSAASLQAAEALEMIWEIGLRPFRIAPTAEEGVAITFITPGGLAGIEILDDGSMLTDLPEAGGHRISEVSEDEELVEYLVALRATASDRPAIQDVSMGAVG